MFPVWACSLRGKSSKSAASWIVNIIETLMVVFTFVINYLD